MQTTSPRSLQHPSDRLAERDAAYVRLMAINMGGHNGHLFARVLSSWCLSEGVLPARLGLSDDAFHTLLTQYFPDADLVDDAPGRGEFDVERLPEREDLIELLLQNRRGDEVAEVWLAYIIATACMGMDHLWQNMGLWSRTELSELMQRNFPLLAERNNRDMKWKKFLYKQLCEKEGLNACRAPSCDLCADFKKCFGPEE